MGGVDRCDQNITAYRIGIRGKKRLVLFVWVLDMVQNCWAIYSANKEDADPNYDLLSFRCEIANSIIQQDKTKMDSLASRVPHGRVLPANRRVSVDVRYNGFMHFQELFDVTKRCAECNKNTKGCKKFNVGLHDHCFKGWHGLQ